MIFPVEFNQKISQIRQNIGPLVGIPVAHQTYMLLLTGKHCEDEENEAWVILAA